MFEKAKWITGDLSIKTDGSQLLRKEIHIPMIFKSVVLNIAMLGYGEVTLNGKSITDEVLSTPFTKFDSTVLYNTYDITDMVHSGNFVIGAFIGNGWYNDVAQTWDFQCATWRHHPKMIAQVDITLKTGAVLSYVSDSSWKVSEGPCVYNHTREGETYDARLEKAGWNTYGFDDSGWENAKVCRGAGGILKKNNMPQPKVIRTIIPEKIGNGLYDLGEGISGWARIEAKGEAGKEITIEYAELLTENGEVHPHINVFLARTGSTHINRDIYIMKGEGVETYAPKFAYHGFRYIKVTGAPEDFKIVAEVVHTDLETIGSFECSDEMLNEIHKASVRSTLTNYLSVPTDCPHREQNGWTGDAFISCQQALLNFDMAKSYDKWMDDFKDVQRKNGQLPGIVPTSGWGYNWGSGPAWDGAMMVIPWYVYQNTGDSSLIYKMWDNMKLYMEYMDDMAEDYIVNFGLGDWCPPKTTDVCPAVVTDTAYYYNFAVLMEKYAEILGENGVSYGRLADNIKMAFREKFFGDSSLEKKQTYLACIIYQNLCEPSEAPVFAEKLAELVKNNDYHIDCGILGTKYIFSALSDFGYADVAYKMVVNPTMPSYAYWINQGFKNLCESWEIVNSCNHHMFSEVDHWFYRHVAGIHIDENGIVIKPCFIVDWVKAKHRDIEVSWDKDKVCVTVPKYSTLDIDGKIYELNVGYNEFSR